VTKLAFHEFRMLCLQLLEYFETVIKERRERLKLRNIQQIQENIAGNQRQTSKGYVETWANFAFFSFFS